MYRANYCLSTTTAKVVSKIALDVRLLYYQRMLLACDAD